MIDRRYLLVFVPLLVSCISALHVQAMNTQKPLTALERKAPISLDASLADHENVTIESTEKYDEMRALSQHAADSKIALMHAQSLLRLRNIRIPRKTSPEVAQKRLSSTGQQLVTTDVRVRKKVTKNPRTSGLAQGALTPALEGTSTSSEKQSREAVSAPSSPQMGAGLPRDIQQLIHRFSIRAVENTHSYLTMASHRRFSLNKETGAVVQGDFGPGIDSMVRSPNGTYYADCYDARGTSIYNAHTGMFAYTLYRDIIGASHTAVQGPSHDVVAWSPDSTWIAVGREIGVRIFESSSGELVYKSAAKEFPGVTQLAWSCDGSHVAILHHHMKISVMHAATKDVVYAVDHSYVGIGANRHVLSCVQPIQWSPCGQMLALAHRNTDRVDIFDVQIGLITCSFRCQQYATTLGQHMTSTNVEHFKWSPNGDYLAIDYGARMCVLNVGEKRAVGFLRSGNYFSWNNDGEKLVIVLGLTGAEVYDFKRETCAYKIMDPVDHCVWSPDGARLAVVRIQGQGIHIHDGHTGKFIHELPQCKGIFAWSPDSSCLVAAGNGGSLCLYDVAQGRVSVFPCKDQIKSIQFSGNNTCLVNLITQTTLVYDLPLFACLKTLSLSEYELLKKLDMSDSIMPLMADAQEWKLWKIVRAKLPERAQKSIGERIVRSP